MTVNTAKVGDILMNYCSFGEGEKAFVIIPGLSIKPVTLSADGLQSAFADYTKDFTIYVFDRRTNIEAGYSLNEMAEDTVAVMKSLGLTKVSIFGASQGGMIAQLIAINHPDLVEKLVLASTTSKVSEGTAGKLTSWIELAKSKDAYKLNKIMTEDIYAKATVEAFGEVLLAVGNNISQEELDRFVIIASSILGFDVYDKLPEIKAETFVVGCKGDKVMTAIPSLKIAERLNCEFRIYGEEYGHGVYDEAPDFRSNMLAFLTK